MISIQRMDKEEYIEWLDREFKAHGKKRKEGYYRRCFEENQSGQRVTLIGFDEDRLAGCCHLLMRSDYSGFANRNIPEINDLNVFPEFQRRGIATMMFEEFEHIARQMSYTHIGIGVGLYADYGKAQIMYFHRGFVPDGTGLKYEGKDVVPGTMVRVDDELVLYFTKSLEA